MLTLTRRVGESFTITTPDGIKLKLYVSNLKRSQVKFSIDAPKNFRVLRTELETPGAANDITA